MKQNIYRTIYCGLVNEELVDQEIKIAGWIENIRDHGGVIFVDVRDEHGTVQVVSNDESLFDNLTKESTVTISGIVRKRKEEDYNNRIKTGKIEVLAKELTVLGKAKNVLPFDVMTSHEVSEEVRLRYRYLDLRNTKSHNSILFRNQVIKYLREKMENLGHTEIQTPILTASSPEGARDFIVPSRKFQGKFYALPQAPQIFKQLLMISGFDKYFQIAPCFRDEDARNDRIYGEFYQLDLEMAFATEEDVLEVGEEIFYDTFKKFSTKEISTRPFRRLSYKESMDKYGTDKPDLRNPLEIKDVSEIFIESGFKPFRGNIVKAIRVENISDKPNSWFNELVDYANSIGMPGIGYFKVLEDMTFSGPIDKFLSETERESLIKEVSLTPNSVIFFIADRKMAPKFAGQIRMELGRKLNLIDENKFAFCIVKDFPMYEYNDEDKKYDFSHNPFSMPKGGMEALENSNIEDITAYQFDFVCNGIEMASGAVRNHDLDIMRKAFNLAGYEESVIEEKFKSLYTAFQYGAPPHAGMAPGIDRMLMLLNDEISIRETIAFPLSASGQDMMMGCPSEVTEKQLREVHIKVRVSN
ncbi:MAG: aspartate--tRNA ligase [Bacilli bacterium]|nr:aspartate--tRNA ligase [Bacilli bacterium]